MQHQPAVNKDKLVRFKNSLSAAVWRLTLPELRVMLVAMAKAAGQARPGLLYKITVDDVAELGLSRSHIYDELKMAGGRLFDRKIRVFFNADSSNADSISGKADYLDYRWVSAARYDDRHGTVSLAFSAEVIPFLVDLTENFTQLALREAQDLDSQYALRLYLCLSRFVDTGWAHLTVEDLRAILEIDSSKLPRYGNFKQRVLKPSCDKINSAKYTRFHVEFEEIKEGRKITKLRFILSKKEVKIPTDIDYVELTFEQREMLTDWLFGKNLDKVDEIKKIHPNYTPSYFINWLYKNDVCVSNVYQGKSDQEIHDHFRDIILTNNACIQKLREKWLNPLRFNLMIKKIKPKKIASIGKSVKLNDDSDNSSVNPINQLDSNSESEAFVVSLVPGTRTILSEERVRKMAQIFAGSVNPAFPICSGQKWSERVGWKLLIGRGADIHPDDLSAMSVSDRTETFFDLMRNEEFLEMACIVLKQFGERF